MPVPAPPPPPPPPPPAAIQAPIPKSNKQLLSSIEKGTKLKKVPESAKNDRSSGLAAAGIAPSGTNHASGPIARSQGAKPAMSNDLGVFQSQLKNQLMAIKPGSGPSNGGDRRSSLTTKDYVSLRPPSAQSVVTKPSAINQAFAAPTKNSSPSSVTTRMQPEPAIVNSVRSSSTINKGQPPYAPTNRPQLNAFNQPFATSNTVSNNHVINKAAPIQSWAVTKATIPSVPQTNNNNFVVPFRKQSQPFDDRAFSTRSEPQSANLKMAPQPPNKFQTASTNNRPFPTLPNQYPASDINKVPLLSSHIPSFSNKAPTQHIPNQSIHNSAAAPANKNQSFNNSAHLPYNQNQSNNNKANFNQNQSINIRPPPPTNQNPSINNRTPSPFNQNQSINNRASPTFNQNQSINIRPPYNQNQSINNREPAQSKPNEFAHTRAPPPPNQFHSADVRAPPPPPPVNSKPKLGSASSMDCIGTITSVPSNPAMRVRPPPQPALTNNNNFTARTAPYPPPYVNNVATRPPPTATSAAPLSSLATHRFTEQPAAAHDTYKVANRAPPPPPPPPPQQHQQISATRLRNSTKFSLLDRRFTFPDEAQFPGLR